MPITSTKEVEFTSKIRLFDRKSKEEYHIRTTIVTWDDGQTNASEIRIFTPVIGYPEGVWVSAWDAHLTKSVTDRLKAEALSKGEPLPCP